MADLVSFSSDRSQWPLLHDLILSGQIPEDRLVVLSDANPAFWSWHSATPFPPGHAVRNGGTSANVPASHAQAGTPVLRGGV